MAPTRWVPTSANSWRYRALLDEVRKRTSVAADPGMTRPADFRLILPDDAKRERIRVLNLRHGGSVGFRHRQPKWITFRSAPTGKYAIEHEFDPPKAVVVMQRRSVSRWPGDEEGLIFTVTVAAIR